MKCLFKIICSALILTTPFASKIVANDTFSNEWVTGSDRAYRIMDEYEEGKWDAFLAANEVEYQKYLTRHNPHLAIDSLDAEERELLAQNYLELLHIRRKQVGKIYEELEKICHKHNIDPWCYANRGKKDSDPSIIKIAGDMSMEMLVLSLSSPNPVSFMHRLELGLGVYEKYLGSLYEKSLGEEIALFAEMLIPIQVEFTVRSFLADQKNGNPDTLFVLEWEKYRRLCVVLREIIGDLSEDHDREFYKTNKYIAYDYLHELSESCFFEFMIMDSFRHDCRFLNSLASGTKSPSNAIEEDCVPILKKHQNILGSQWEEKVKSLKYSYLLQE